MSDITLTKFDDFYMVDITTYNSSNIYLNGKPLDMAATGKRFTVKQYPQFTRRNTQSFITEWVNVEDSDHTMSPQRYQVELELLLAGAEEDDDGDLVFSKLEAEFAYRKFKAMWKPVSEVKESFTQMTVTERHGMLNGEDFIEPMFCYDSNKPDLMVYNRSANIMHHFEEMTKKYDLKWARESHSGIYYWKLNGKYVFSNNETFKLKNGTSTGTLAHCRAMRDADTKLVRSTIYGAITPADQLPQYAINDLRVKVSSAIGKIEDAERSRTSRERSSHIEVARKLLGEAVQVFNNVAE